MVLRHPTCRRPVARRALRSRSDRPGGSTGPLVRRERTPGWAALALLLVFVTACGRSADVVLYCAVDRAHSEPIVRAFEEATGLKVDFRSDVEASKSVGHRRRLQEERHNPRCDVFWNNEVVQTVLLADAGLLEPYVSPEAADLPEHLRDPDGHWAGFGARARVIIVNTEAGGDLPGDLESLGEMSSTRLFLDPTTRGRAAMARPLTGTTAAHGAIWMEALGQEATVEQLRAMQANDVVFVDGNGHVMRLVREGELDFGWTDTDDVKAAIDQGFPVAQVLPDQGEGGEGLILIPNTVSLVKGAPHPEAARRLIDYLLSREVEERLAHGDSAQIPVRDDVPRPDGVVDLTGVKLRPVDWNAVGRAYASHVEALEAFFLN